MVRGSDKQKIGALINLGAYYFVGIPSGAFLAFVYHIGGKVAIALIYLLIYIYIYLFIYGNCVYLFIR